MCFTFRYDSLSHRALSSGKHSSFRHFIMLPSWFFFNPAQCHTYPPSEMEAVQVLGKILLTLNRKSKERGRVHIVLVQTVSLFPFMWKLLVAGLTLHYSLATWAFLNVTFLLLSSNLQHPQTKFPHVLYLKRFCLDMNCKSH